MSALFRNRYRIGSNRYKGYDYSSPGKYFITICTKNKVPYFGEIVSGKMILSTLGNIVGEIWREIPKHFINVKLDKYIIMPDHIHGIIIINENLQNDAVEPLHATVLRQQNSSFSQQQNKMVQQQSRNDFPSVGHMSSISPKSGSLAIIIRSYKSAVSKHIHKIDAGFEWQQSFYDRIIRTQKQLNFILKYIIENPQKWLN